MNTKEKNELIDIETLSYEEFDELNDQFFKEHPEYVHIREKQENYAKKVTRKNPLIVSLFISMILGFVATVIVIFTQGFENPLFKVLIVFTAICFIAFFITTIIDFNHFDSDVDKWVESAEFKEYEKALENFYNSKGYYNSEELDDEE